MTTPAVHGLADTLRDAAAAPIPEDLSRLLAATAEVLGTYSDAIANFAAAKLTTSGDDGVALFRRAYDTLASEDLHTLLQNFDTAADHFYDREPALTVGSPVIVEGVVVKARGSDEYVVEFEGRVDDPLTDETARVVAPSETVHPWVSATGEDSFMTPYVSYAGPRFYEGVLPWNED